MEVIQTEIPLSSEDPSLGLVLTEMAGNEDGRGLVLVSEVYGNAENARSCPILVGDIITGVRTSDGSVRERTTGLNYDRMVEAIGDVKGAALKGDGLLHLELNRLVKRATIQVQVIQPDNNMTTVQALAGENLRRLLLRKDIRLYNRKTKRFDMPYATGTKITCRFITSRWTTSKITLSLLTVISPTISKKKAIAQGKVCVVLAS